MTDETDELDILARERVGRVLHDKWRLERLLGVGGMAAVYAATHRNGARAAVKVLHTHLSRYTEVRERFQREAYVSNRVAHPGAVKVLDDDVVADGPDAGMAYIVMELLQGESLDERMERQPPIGEVEFLRIAGSVLEVLRAAHAHGVIHRDLKPENLFLAREPEGGPGAVRVKVLDFGMARLLQGQAITSYGVALGTPSFMSPEQAAGHNDEIDGRTDLFALGATGFRIRTGTRIHSAETVIELVGKMARLPAARIGSVTPDVSEPFARVIDRALQFRREDRYPSAEVMLAAVKAAIGEIDKTGAGKPAKLGDPSAPAQEQPTIALSSSDLEPWPGRSEVPLAAAGRRRRGSIVPWVVLLACAALGTKVFVESKRRAIPWPWQAHVSLPVVDAASDVPEVRDASGELRDASRAPSVVPVDASAPPAATTQPNPSHHPAPPKSKPIKAPKATPKRPPARPIAH